MKHILSILVKNRPGVMSHVSGLFTRRSYNIDSIAVGVTENPAVSVITIVLKGDEKALGQFQGQLLKLPDVVEVKSLPFHDSLIRELVLVRIKSDGSKRNEIFGIVEVFGGKVAEVTEDSILIEIHGSGRQIHAAIDILAQFGIIEMARTGAIALAYRTDTGAG
ncbi:MAG TPA: acetolactate synthase small subunit [Leptospiraceae bacterium]|nr:acetolactate synthase small subunit [Leptospirales bacterium]HMU81962.1 acetolactate synthase small subunit [Leptospiraceae bacterium]HMX55755.1 acetolactate synthase small subunit [Leptospiraceae bacterium]HMY45312.1 acetolactate synthase small subunit [Leptospiraceae bacterium]HMZ36663.1 acetolactate synthase small subunit [Leptospiraceae bacterium]